MTLIWPWMLLTLLFVPLLVGGYLRLLPLALIRRGIRCANRAGHPGVLYLHPWELDPDQPRIRAGRLARVRHYTNLRKTEGRLRRLLGEFAFGTLREVLGQCRAR